MPHGTNNITTTGNNADAFLDRNFDQQPDIPRPLANNRVFDFSQDLTQDPTNYEAASTGAVVYRANWYHDRLYDLGLGAAGTTRIILDEGVSGQ